MTPFHFTQQNHLQQRSLQMILIVHIQHGSLQMIVIVQFARF